MLGDVHVVGRICLYLRPVDHGIVLARAWLSTVVLTGLEEGQAGGDRLLLSFDRWQVRSAFDGEDEGRQDFVFSQDGG